jgi:peptidoglycan-N-acetylglucosamine deacetylase
MTVQRSVTTRLAPAFAHAPARRLLGAVLVTTLAFLTSCAPSVTPPAVSRQTAPSAPPAATSPTPAPTSGAPATPTAAVPSTPSTAATSAAWAARYRGKVVRGFIPERGYKAVALTFDDGPNHETGYVIDTLERFGGRATFFFTGKLLSRPGALSQASLVQSHGFEVGNHTQDHSVANRSSLLGRTYAFDVAQIEGPDHLVEPLIGHPTLWVRPMGGEIDSTGVRAAKNTGHLVITWSVDSRDSHGWDNTPAFVFHNATTGIVSGDVILLHVTHPESMAALPRICAALRDQGFQLVTVSELAAHSRPLLGLRH